MIFRLGRLLSGGARGPGVFFIIPCVDIYEKIDMRVQNFDVPPQEVSECLGLPLLQITPTLGGLLFSLILSEDEGTIYLKNNVKGTALCNSVRYIE